jgi:hypothetical protein
LGVVISVKDIFRNVFDAVGGLGGEYGGRDMDRCNDGRTKEETGEGVSGRGSDDDDDDDDDRGTSATARAH